MKDQLTLFVADTHASHSPLPGSAEARKMTATSGLNLVGSWLNLGPLGSLEKTLLGTSAWASTMCFLTWKDKATPAGRLLFQLAPSQRHIDEIGFGLWPTPSASDNRDRGNMSTPAIARRIAKGKQVMLSMSVSQESGALNPTWVEWLMGFPEGWTDLKPSEMP